MMVNINTKYIKFHIDDRFSAQGKDNLKPISEPYFSQIA